MGIGDNRTGAYPVGVIEGFYGRPWSWSDRRAQISFLAQAGLPAYVYAPKADPYLRKRWQEAWPEPVYRELAGLAATCRSSRVAWGVGFSPFEIYRRYDARARRSLRNKLDEINRLEPDILCLLFDDMRGDLPELAARQAEIAHDILGDTVARHVIMCPTYYSEDAVLEKVFGPRPVDYWAELGARLDPRVSLFWTGQKVCSTSYTRDSLREIAEQLQRPPVLWDNYPVNDGARMSRRLNLQPFSQRPLPGVDWLRGHLVNPMNQAWLSRLVLATLPVQGGDHCRDFIQAAHRCCPPELAELLVRDLELFSGLGLDGLLEGDKRTLLGDYGPIDHPAAREVFQWLKGEYRFDPACLTD